MRKFLLDGGTHLGQGLKQIMKKHAVDSTWQVHTWEANTHTWNRYRGRNPPEFIHSHNQALSDHEGMIMLNVETALTKHEQGMVPIGQGSSILDLEDWKAGPHIGVFQEQLQITCIDFAQWIKDHCDQQDYIVCKLDIEGAEYQVLSRMLDLGVMSWIDCLYVEWHAQMINNTELLEQEVDLKKAINCLGVKLVEWY